MHEWANGVALDINNATRSLAKPFANRRQSWLFAYRIILGIIFTFLLTKVR